MLLNNLHQITCKVFASGCLCSKPSSMLSTSSSALSTALYCKPITNSRSMKSISTRRLLNSKKNINYQSASPMSSILSTTQSLSERDINNNNSYFSFRLFSSTNSDKQKQSQPQMSTSQQPNTETSTIEPTNFKDKVSYMWKNYGKLAIGTYFTIYVTTLGELLILRILLLLPISLLLLLLLLLPPPLLLLLLLQLFYSTNPTTTILLPLLVLLLLHLLLPLICTSTHLRFDFLRIGFRCI